MALNLGELFVTLGVELRDFDAKFSKAQQTVSAAEQKLQKDMQGFQQTASGLLVPLGSVSEKLESVSKGSGKAGDGLNKLGGHAHGAKQKAEGLVGTLTDMNAQMGLMMGGASLSAAFTAPFVLMSKAAMDASIGFESAFAGVRKTFTATEGEFKQIEDRFRSMAQSTPVAAEEFARIGELAGQLGVRGVGNLTAFTDVVAKLGVTTNLSTEEAATSLARFANIMQMPMENADRLGSTIVDLGNNLATTEQEITQFALRIAGAGKQVGLSEAQVVGFGAALSSVGIEAEAGGTAISRVFAKLATVTAKGGADLKLFASVAGMSGEAFAKAFKEDAASATISFIGGLKRLQDAGVNVFGVLEKLELQDIRVRDALLRTAGAGDLLTRSIGLASEAWTKNTALNEEAGKRFQTTESKLQMLKNSFDELVRRFGDAVSPVLNGLIDHLQTAVAVLQDIPMPIQMAIAGFGGLAAVVGPLMLALAGFGATMAGIKAALPVLGAIFAGVSLSVGLAVVAVAALTVGIGAYAVSQRRAQEQAQKNDKSLLKLSGRYEELKAVVDDTTKSEHERSKAADEMKTLNKQLGDIFPNLISKWDDHGNAVELDTKKLRENTQAVKDNMRAKAQGEVDNAEAALKRLEENRESLRKLISQTADTGGSFAAGASGAWGSGMEFLATADLNKQLRDLENQIVDARERRGAAYTELYGPVRPEDPRGDQREMRRYKGGTADGAQDFEEGTTEKIKYLNEFETAFDRSQADMLEKFSRAQQDATSEFKSGQDQRMREFETVQQRETAVLEQNLDNRKATFERSQEEDKAKFQRGQEDQLIVFKNRLEDEKNAFEKQLDDKRITFDQAQDKEKEVFQRAQERKLIDFKNGLEDERDAYDRQLDDLSRAFERAQSAEKERYQRHQEDLLHAYRERQDKELEALRDKHAAEKIALDKAFDDRTAALKDKQKALREAAAQEEATNRLIDANERLAKANEAINAAERSGDPKEMAEAKLRLAHAVREREEAIADEVRRVENERLNDQISALDKERDVQEKALGEKQKTALGSLKDQQEDNLIAYKRVLEDDKIAFEARLEQAKTNYGREQKALKEALARKQETRLENYKNELEDDKIAFETRLEKAKTNFAREQGVQREAFQRQQEETLLGYQRQLDDDKTFFNRRQEQAKLWFEQALADWKKAESGKREEAKRGLQILQDAELEAWKRIQEDRTVQYKRELEDLKDSFAKKLTAQSEFLADWKAIEKQMQGSTPSPIGSVAPPIPAAPAATTPAPAAPPASQPPPWALPPGTPVAPTDPWAMPPDTTPVDAARMARDLETWGGNTTPVDSRKMAETIAAWGDTMGNFPKLAAGGVVNRPTLAMIGEGRESEAVTPLSWLGEQMQQIGERIAATFSRQMAVAGGLGPIRMPQLDSFLSGQRGMGNFIPDGAAAMAAVGAPEVRVFVGNREIFDLIVEANEDARRRGRS